MEFDIVVAVDSHNGIGKNNSIPWKLTTAGRNDMQFFTKLTRKHSTAVIMGRRTAESIPKKFWPLSMRTNIVLSRACNGSTMVDESLGAPVVNCGSLLAALAYCKDTHIENVYVIGGGQLYSEAILHPLCRNIYVSRIDGDYECDTFFPMGLLDGCEYSCDNLETEVGSSLNVQVYKYKNYYEVAYQNLLSTCLGAQSRQNRTGVPTHGGFGAQLRFPLDGILPLLTTKRVLFESVFHELIWFLRGDNDTKYLTDNRVHIWDSNTTQEALDRAGLGYSAGTVGAAYGHQWRHFGASVSLDGYRTGQTGIDQIRELIDGIKSDPYSRRHIVTAWNPQQVDKAALPPCHIMFQMYVDGGKLSTMVTMRSCDVFLGLPFNIASYSLLTYLVAHVCGLGTHELVFSVGDYHLYENQLDAAKVQLGRTARKFPTVCVDKSLPRDIDELVSCIKYSDIAIDGYYPHSRLRVKMVA
jgi:dihydrofolate reductase / thymidylate synthase